MAGARASHRRRTGRRFRPVLGGLALLWLAGCASGPEPEPPTGTAPPTTEKGPKASGADPSSPGKAEPTPAGDSERPSAPEEASAAAVEEPPEPAPALPVWFRRAQSAPDRAVGCAPWTGNPGQADVVATSRAKAKLGRQQRTRVKGSVELTERRRREDGKVADRVEVRQRSVQESRAILRGASVVRSEVMETPGGKRYCVVVAVRAMEEAP